MDSGYKPVTLNSLPVHPFCRVPGVTYSDATSVLYTARLVKYETLEVRLVVEVKYAVCRMYLSHSRV